MAVILKIKYILLLCLFLIGCGGMEPTSIKSDVTVAPNFLFSNQKIIPDYTQIPTVDINDLDYIDVWAKCANTKCPNSDNKCKMKHIGADKFMCGCSYEGKSGGVYFIACFY